MPAKGRGGRTPHRGRPSFVSERMLVLSTAESKASGIGKRAGVTYQQKENPTPNLSTHKKTVLHFLQHSFFVPPYINPRQLEKI